MKTFKQITVCLLALLILFPVAMQADKKEKKPKKPLVWEMPELTGNESFDEFLLYCDTVWNRLQTIEENIPYYSVRKIVNIETGDSCYAVVDSLGNIRSTSKAYSQYVNAAGAAVTLSTDCAMIATLSAAAGLTLPSLGTKMFSYSKYVKIGGQLAIECPKKIALMIKHFNQQKKAIKAYKQNFDETTGTIKDPTIDPDTLEDLNIGDAATLEKTTEEITQGFLAAGAEGEDIDDSIFDDDSLDTSML